MSFQMAKFHSLLMAEYYCIVYRHHIFIHSSVDGHLGYFCILTVVNGASMNTEVHVSIWINSTLFFLVLLRGMLDLSSPNRVQTHAHCCGSVESYPLDHQGIPPPILRFLITTTLKPILKSGKASTYIQDFFHYYFPLAIPCTSGNFEETVLNLQTDPGELTSL